MFPTIFDDGEAGTWADAIYHSPNLKVVEHPRDDAAEWFALVALLFAPFHATTNTTGSE